MTAYDSLIQIVINQENMAYTVEVKNNGRVQLPRDLRAALNLTEGSTLTFEPQKEFIKVMTVQQRLEEARNILKQNTAWDSFTVDDFIRERREEARRELEEIDNQDS
jgi:bifunctional DNA-binding transcriptional regulator/antitoxin component of YhaV-PrlF toxin-antitoxin module